MELILKVLRPQLWSKTHAIYFHLKLAYQAFGEDYGWATIKVLFLLWPHLLFEGKGFYCPQDKGWESPTRSKLTEREIQISS